MSNKIKSILEDHTSVVQSMLQNESLIEEVNLISNLIINCFSNGNKVLLCGNGGSASDAQHISTELSGRFYKDRAPLNAEALHVNTSYLTAVANDNGFDVVYERAVEAKGKPGDVLIALSTSGSSKNILKAILKAKEMEIITIGMTGEKGSSMADLCDHSIVVSSADTPRIQESHILIGHVICELVEASLFPN